ncbi:MAG TPA: hypothetical protein VJR29_00870 [bacterium]|nr:hypothetical protein [bacterium]
MKISSPLPAKALAWSESLGREPDLELRGEGYLHLADDLAAEEHAPAAAEIYSGLLADAALPPKLRQRAQEGLSLLSGGGTFGDRFEVWSRSFLRHASDPKALAAMTAGGLAYRLVRIGVAGRLLDAAASPWTRGFLAQSLATGGGFGAEVLAFTSVHRAMEPSPLSWSRDLSHASLTLGTLKLSGATGGAVAGRLLGPAPRSTLTAGLLQQGSLLGGILLGAELEKAAGWREKDLDSWEALATLLHFNVGGQLSRRWLGSRFAAWENGLDLRWRQTAWNGSSASGGPRLALATAGGPAPRSEAPTASPRFLSVGRGSESGLTPPIVRQLEEKYLRLFPRGDEGFYSEEIIRRACRIRCSLPGFHENLLEALWRSPQRGQVGQLHTLLAIERIFETDALGSSRGSFDYAPLQLLLGQVLSETDPALRHHAMQNILRVFERGFSRSDTSELLITYSKEPISPAQDTPTYDAHFHANHGAEAVRAWPGVREQDLVPLFNFVHREAGFHSAKAGHMIEVLGRGHDPASPYFAAEINGAIDYARFHPQGHLVLNRLYHVLESRDLPSKLSEIVAEPSKIPTQRYVETLGQQGHSDERIAQTLNGGVHTAHFNDLRLAEKVVSVFRESGPYLRYPELRERNRSRLVDHFLNHAAVHRRMNAEQLFGLLKSSYFPRADFFEQAWRQGDFDIRVLPEREFFREVETGGLPRDCEWTLFRQASNRHETDQILVREPPYLRIGTIADRDRAFSETVWRLRGLVHELEHWRHFNGRSENGPVEPFRLAGISREERLITEIMAYLEEFSWRAMNTDDHFPQVARRLGDTLPLYFRNVAEQSYF